MVVAAPSAEFQAQLLVHPVPPKSWASCPSGAVSALPAAARGCAAWGIVALGRRLMVALWRYLEEGLLPKGAELKAAG